MQEESLITSKANHFVQLVDWFPVWLGGGIACYFALLSEPPWWSFVVVVGLCLLAYFVRHMAVFMLLVMSIGFCLAQWQTARVYAPAVPDGMSIASITGRIAEISFDKNRYRVLLDELDIEGLKASETPRKVRLSYRGKDVPIQGQRITARARLYPPSSPAMAGSFDFGRYFFFRQIGAVGLLFSPLEVIDDNGYSSNKSIPFWQSWRYVIQKKIMANIEGDAAGIAIALTTGDKTAISNKVRDDFQAASLSHMLAISGMHMAIICGLFYVVLRSAMSLIPMIYLRVNTKKLAAMLALLASSFYLLLTGFPVSAVRAYIMIVFMLVGVLLDREAFTVRTLMLAASLILIVQPSSLMEAGFQLSFSATLALVVGFRWLTRSFRRAEVTLGIWRRAMNYTGGIMFSSLVASLATLPFVAYHFYQIVPYGILANLLTTTMLGLLVMPALVVFLLLMPLGTGGGVLPLVKWGLEYIASISEWVATLPAALIYIPPISPLAMSIASLGIVIMLMHGDLKWRYAGLAMLVLGMASVVAYRQPDMLISADGKHLAINDDAQGWVLVEGKSTRNFVMNQWQERLGEDMQLLKKMDTPPKSLRCDWQGCVYSRDNVQIALPKRIEVAAEDCLMADMVIASKLDIAALCGDIQLIDKSALQKGGAISIYFDDIDVKVKQSCDVTGFRPWVSGCVLTR